MARSGPCLSGVRRRSAPTRNESRSDVAKRHGALVQAHDFYEPACTLCDQTIRSGAYYVELPKPGREHPWEVCLECANRHSRNWWVTPEKVRRWTTVYF